jgi:hypothetical protein
VRESKGSAALSKGRSSLPSLLGKIPGRGMSDQIPVAPAHSFPPSPASAEANLHASADVDGHQLPIYFPAALDNHHGVRWPVCDWSRERNIQGSRHAG